MDGREQKLRRIADEYGAAAKLLQILADDAGSGDVADATGLSAVRRDLQLLVCQVAYEEHLIELGELREILGVAIGERMAILWAFNKSKTPRRKASRSIKTMLRRARPEITFGVAWRSEDRKWMARATRARITLEANSRLDALETWPAQLASAEGG